MYVFLPLSAFTCCVYLYNIEGRASACAHGTRFSMRDAPCGAGQGLALWQGPRPVCQARSPARVACKLLIGALRRRARLSSGGGTSGGRGGGQTRPHSRRPTVTRADAVPTSRRISIHFQWRTLSERTYVSRQRAVPYFTGVPDAPPQDLVARAAITCRSGRLRDEGLDDALELVWRQALQLRDEGGGVGGGGVGGGAFAARLAA